MTSLRRPAVAAAFCLGLIAVLVLNNFWHWPGDPWVGDPPHEEPRWYSLYDSDASTLAVIAAYAQELSSMLE